MLLCYTSRIDKTNACRAFLTRQAFVRFYGVDSLLCQQLISQHIHLCLSGSICGRADGHNGITDGDVLHAVQLGTHQLCSHGGPGAVLHQANGAALEVLGLEVCQQILHRREEEAS